jgi:tetratricopeptide (TPR) repeat protein
MRSAMTIIVSVSLALFIESVYLAAQQTAGGLQGIISVNSNAAAPPVVRLRLQMFGMTIQETFSRDRRFAFSNIGPGRYTILADAAGYDTVSQTVDLPWEQFTVIELRRQANGTRPGEIEPVWDLRIPESARRQFAVGKKKLLENRCAEAVDHLRKALNAYEEYGDAHRAMGECYARMEQAEAAEKEFKRALEQPHLPDLHLLLGKIYAHRGNETLLQRQIELYVAEEKPSPQRDRMQALLDRYTKR